MHASVPAAAMVPVSIMPCIKPVNPALTLAWCRAELCSRALPCCPNKPSNLPPLPPPPQGAVEEAVVEEKMTSMFIPAVESSVQEFVAKWQDRDETNNFFQK